MSKGRILFVDDTATYRVILGDALIEMGYELIYASDGLEAIQIIKEEISNLDMILLDLLMPKMLGFDVLKDIRHMEGGTDLPVMIITGTFKGTEEMRRVRDLGAVGYIDKSQPIESIVERIDGVLHPEGEEEIEQQIPASILVTYKIGEKPFSAYTHSIGVKGMFIRTKNVAPPGAQIKARFRLEEESETLKVAGRISLIVTEAGSVGQKKLPPGIAIEYTEISPSDEADLEKWIKKKTI